MTISQIASEVRLSQFHFQRLFFRSLGENVSEYVRRRRLERAAKLLAVEKPVSVIQIALECGFETHSAFSKAFKKQFQVTPSEFAAGAMTFPTPVGLCSNRPYLKPTKQKTIAVEADIVELPRLWFHYREQKGVVNGSYFPEPSQVAKAFKEIPVDHAEGVWAYCGGFRGGPAGYFDESAIGHFGLLFLQDTRFDWGKEVVAMEGGRWAVFPHYGDFAHLHLTWNKVCRNWLPSSGLKLRDEWAFESYLVPPENQDPRRATAQIYLPIE
ncbi:MAG: helix-turn-helix domain-containing protein [Casimicrobium sp.]